MKNKLIIGLILLLAISFFPLRNKVIYPYLDHLKLNSSEYEREIRIKQGQYPNLEREVVFNSQKLKIEPPQIEVDKLPKKVLAADAETWIDVNLSTQILCLFHSAGTNCFSVSTGLPRTPTVTGTFHIWTKLPSTLMRGPGYYLPGVPWTMYFYKGYGIHGTYWHNNFGHPMSHGCVNMYTPEAQFVYDRVAVGTRVVVHY